MGWDGMGWDGMGECTDRIRVRRQKMHISDHDTMAALRLFRLALEGMILTISTAPGTQSSNSNVDEMEGFTAQDK
jgi:hypothetical protein